MDKRTMLGTFLFKTGSTWLWRRINSRNNKNRLIILAYHRVIDYNPASEFPTDEELVSATPQAFEEQVAWLSNNFKVTTFSRLSKEQVEPNSLIITFDDGYRDNYLHAYPILKKYGIPATIFLSTGYIGTTEMYWWDKLNFILKKTSVPRFSIKLDSYKNNFYLQNQHDRKSIYNQLVTTAKAIPNAERIELLEQVCEQLQVPLPSEPMALNWDEVREMANNGIEMGGHTVTHPILSQTPQDTLRHEIEECRSTIIRETGQQVTAFSYPVGGNLHFNKQSEDIVQKAGYQFAASYVHGVDNPRSRNWFTLKRIHVEKEDSFPVFCSMLQMPELIDFFEFTSKFTSSK
jgi:peptidoglycan/xylan/chitin deacetylase (PgdA/CDA1 family)